VLKHIIIYLIFFYSLIDATELDTPSIEKAQSTSFLSSLTKKEKYIATNTALATGILGWGFSQWGYGEEKYHTDDEGWFEKDTSNGGSDKLGHFYTNYLVTRLLSDLYAGWGYSRDDAALYASFSSFALSSVMIEIGDGYSEHGFSKEDLLADSLGIGVGYLLATQPSLANKLDFRFEYKPSLHSENVTDFTTDYEHMKHLMVLKAEGFESLEDSYLSYLELHLGYYSRDFNHDTMPLEGRRREVYLGVGVNLSKLLRPYMGNYSKVFNYYQTPYTYVSMHN